MPNTSVFAFFQEFLQRLFTRSPKFFRVFQVIAGALTFIGYVPAILQRWFGVEVPGHTITMFEDIAKYAAGFFAAAFLPVNSKPIAVTESGEVIKKTDEVKLPYTAAAEQAHAEKQDLPPAEVIK